MQVFWKNHNTPHLVDIKNVHLLVLRWSNSTFRPCFQIVAFHTFQNVLKHFVSSLFKDGKHIIGSITSSIIKSIKEIEVESFTSIVLYCILLKKLALVGILGLGEGQVRSKYERLETFSSI